jgi:hypothetical protein
VKTSRGYGNSEQRMSSGAKRVSQAILDSKCNDEVFGHCVRERMEDRGMTLDEFARKLSLVNKKITKHDLSQLIEGQIAPYLSLETKRDIYWALGLVENRGDADSLSHEQLDALVLPKNPRQLGMKL